jgi:hypothetical protein
MALLLYLVTLSNHIIVGYRQHTQSTGINNNVGLVADLKLLRASKVIENEIYHRELDIHLMCDRV